MDITNDMMLDALCLAAYSDTEETRILLNQVLQIYQDTKKKNQDSVNLDLEVIFNIIDDIVKADIDLGRKSEVNRIILRIKKSPIAEKDPTFLTSVIEILNEDPTNIKPSRIRNLTRKLQQWIVLTKSRLQAQQLLMKCARYNPTDDVTNDVLINDVAEYARNLLAIQDNAAGASETIDVVDMTNPNSIKKALTVYKNKRKSSVFKTGLKQLNRMLGENGGFLRGEFGAFAASSHNFKSGMLMKCARWFCTKSNIPVPQGMTPTVVLISLENEVPENTMDMLREAYVDIYRQPIPDDKYQHMLLEAYVDIYRQPIPDDMKEDELIERVSEYYDQKGIKFIMYRFDENFGFSDFVKLMTGLKNRGLCVIATVIDYITLMRLEGDDKDNQPKRLQKLGQHFANYAKRNDMLIVTGLQLNSAADELNASGKTNIVKLYNAFHLSDCKGLIKELDILIFMYIEENQDGVPFLTLAFRKHRGCKRPPKKEQYAAYRFHPIMGILEDEGLDVDYNRDDIYSDELPSEEEAIALFDGIRSQNKSIRAEEKAQEENLEPQDEYEFG